MIAISSFRPLDTNEEYRKNQIAAFESWNKVFDAIVFFNAPDERMKSGITSFFPSEDYPFILTLAGLASRFPENLVCLINSDIVASPDLLYVEQTLKENKASCAVSHRWQFDPVNLMQPKQVVDLGLDIFVGTSEVWGRVARLVPEEFRIGHGMWDTWLIAFFNKHFASTFYDFTPSRCIFHPKHGGRQSKFDLPKSLLDGVDSGLCGMPVRKIS